MALEETIRQPRITSSHIHDIHVLILLVPKANCPTNGFHIRCSTLQLIVAAFKLLWSSITGENLMGTVLGQRRHCSMQSCLQGSLLLSWPNKSLHTVFGWNLYTSRVPAIAGSCNSTTRNSTSRLSSARLRNKYSWERKINPWMLFECQWIFFSKIFFL